MKLKKIIMSILSSLCVVLFSLITIIGTWQVVTRYLFNKPSAWTEEILTYGFVWMAMLASAYVFGSREHMRLTFVIDKFDDKKRRKYEILTEIFTILFSLLVFVYGGIKICMLTSKQITPALQWSTGMLYSVIPICGVIIVLLSVINIIELKKK